MPSEAEWSPFEYLRPQGKATEGCGVLMGDLESTDRSLPVALIVNCGKNDLQVWVREGDQHTGRSPFTFFPRRGTGFRGFQDGLRQGEIPHRILLPGAERLNTAAAVPWAEYLHRLGRTDLVSGHANRHTEEKEPVVLVDRDDALLLRPGKIEHLVAHLSRQAGGPHTARAFDVRRVLTFGTERQKTSGNFYWEEPFVFPELLAIWLAEHFRIPFLAPTEPWTPESGQAKWATWANFMDGLDTLEGRPGTADHPVHRDAARIIDDAISKLASGLTEPVYAIVSQTGGMADTKPVILASAELRFEGRSFDYDETEVKGGLITPNDVKLPRRFLAPARDLDLRNECRALILRGEFSAAGAVVESLPSDVKEGHAWLQSVSSMGDFFRAATTLHDLDIALEIKSNGGIKDDGSILNAREDRILQRAFEVEAAIQAPVQNPDRPEHYWRIQDAVLAVVAVVEYATEAMVFPALRDFLMDEGCDWVVDDDGVVMTRQGHRPSNKEWNAGRDDCSPVRHEARTKILKHIHKHLGLAESDLAFAPQDSSLFDKYKPRVDLRSHNEREWWREFLRGHDARAERDNNRGEALSEYEEFLFSNDRAGNVESPRAYRNRVGHGVLSQQDRKHALIALSQPLRRGEPGNILIRPDAPPGERYLGTPLTRKLFAALGVHDISGVYKARLERLLEFMTQPLPTSD